jgi:uncharacterized protein (TIGR03084 family)
VPADLGHLCDALAAESAVLDALVAPLDDADWTTPTPAPGWTVHDQISHLAHFDDMCVLAATDPAAFRPSREHALADVDGFTAEVAAQHRAMAHADLLAWWRRARAGVDATFRTIDPSTRVPWYGPDMSTAAAVTSRIMETWAHGQDVADALGFVRPDTMGLREVAHLGVRALPNSFVAQGLPVPDAAVRVELVGPGGAVWTWGDPAATDAVRGSARDFCLVTTQRRHLADTDLVATGAVATRWLTIAQAFAGPPGAGRQPGQHASGAGGAS